jgi:hypothetical protein
MNLLYTNRSQKDQDFIKYVCNDLLLINPKNKITNNLFAAIFIEGRNRFINSLEDYACFHSFHTFSEYAYQHPMAWDILNPILVRNKGTAAFIFTPNGQNHAHALYNTNLKSKIGGRT